MKGHVSRVGKKKGGEGRGRKKSLSSIHIYQLTLGVLSWDKHILSSGARDGSIWNHDVRIANHKVGELLGHESEVCGLKWRPDGQMLASGGNDNMVNIWDARSSVPKFSKTEHTAAVKVRESEREGGGGFE